MKRIHPVVSYFAGVLLVLAQTPQSVRAYTVKRTESGMPIRWKASMVPMTINTAAYKKIKKELLAESVAIATDAWRGSGKVTEIVASGDSNVAVGHVGSEPTNGVYVVDELPTGRDRLAITVSTYNAETGETLDADVLVCSKFAFDVLPVTSTTATTGKAQSASTAKTPSTTSTKYDLPSVLTHEFGHVLGLGESDVAHSTMYPTMNAGETYKRIPASDDEAGLEEAYAASEPDAESPAGCIPSTVGGRTNARATHWWCAVVACATIVLWRRTRRTSPTETRRRVHATVAALLVVTPAFSVFAARQAPDARSRFHSTAPSVLVIRNGASRTASGYVEEHVTSQMLAQGAQGHPLRNVLRGLPHRAAFERPQATFAHRLGARKTGGLVWTHYSVQVDGRVRELRVPGGRVGSIVQVVGDAPVPRDGEHLLVTSR